jgi:hypothetical protein
MSAFSAQNSNIHTSLSEYGIFLHDTCQNNTRFGFMQRRIQIYFEDTMKELVMSENMMLTSSFEDGLYLTNMLKYYNYDKSVLDLSCNYVKHPVLNHQMITINVPYIKPAQPDSATMIVNIYGFVKWVEMGNERFKDYTLSSNSGPPPGYRLDGTGVAFKAPMAAVNDNWIPLYEFTFNDKHHFYSTKAKFEGGGVRGGSNTVGTIICYIAESNEFDSDLVPIYEMFDANYGVHRFRITPDTEIEAIIGYAYSPNYTS